MIFYINKIDSKLWISLGIQSRKTYIENRNIFDNVPREYKKDFVRGYFDGDGCVCVKKKGKRSNNHVFHLTSYTSSILESVKEWFIDFNITLNLNKHGEYFRLQKSGNKELIKIREILYYDNCMCLERKRTLFFNIAEHKPKWYTYHKQSKRFRIRHPLEKNKTFKTELECVEYLEKIDGECIIR